MANNFKNSFVSVTSELVNIINQMLSDSDTGIEVVYTINNGSGVNSVLIELDASNTGNQVVSYTVICSRYK